MLDTLYNTYFFYIESTPQLQSCDKRQPCSCKPSCTHKANNDEWSPSTWWYSFSRFNQQRDHQMTCYCVRSKSFTWCVVVMYVKSTTNTHCAVLSKDNNVHFDKHLLWHPHQWYDVLWIVIRALPVDLSASVGWWACSIFVRTGLSLWDQHHNSFACIITDLVRLWSVHCRHQLV